MLKISPNRLAELQERGDAKKFPEPIDVSNDQLLKDILNDTKESNDAMVTHLLETMKAKRIKRLKIIRTDIGLVDYIDPIYEDEGAE